MPDFYPLLILFLAGGIAALFPKFLVGLLKRAASGFTEHMTPHESYGFEWVIRLLGITSFLFGAFGFLKYFKIM